MEKTSVIDLRKLNRKKQIINLLKQHGQLSKNDIAKMTRHSISTVIAAVDELFEEGLIEQCGVGQVSVGRPPVFYTLRADYGYSIGIDFNSESIHVSLSNMSRQITHSIQRRLRTAPMPIREIIAQALKLCEDLLSQFEKRPSILCVGISSPGPLDASTKRLNYYSLSPDEQNIDLFSPFAERFECPVYVDKNLNCLAVAYKNRTSTPTQNMILVGIRAGVGASCILDGNIYRGAGGDAGNIGHTRVPGSAKLCKCGKVGCLDAELSIYAITRKMDNLLGEAVSDNGTPLSVAEKMALFVQRVRHSQPDCLRILDECCYYLSQSVDMLANLFNPSNISFYGEITQCGQIFIDNLVKYMPASTLSSMTLSLTSLSQYAFAEGAALFALDQYFTPSDLV